MNRLILGDCLSVLKTLELNSIDLIYLDPPFFSNRNYEVIWGDTGEIRSFEDRWSGGIDHYISWLKERVLELHRVLKPTGSIFLHCDWHANAEIKVFILNKIFGEQNFRGEIIWRRAQAHNDAVKKLAVLTDTIWYYSKSNHFFYYPIYGDMAKSSEKLFKYEDKRGKYRYVVLTGPGVSYGESGEEWRNYNPTKIGRHWAVPNIVLKELIDKEKFNSMSIKDKLDLLYQEGFIIFSKNGIPSIKKYLDQSKGIVIGNFWVDISFGATSKERIGYPTQKPEALLARIIQCASNEGDQVLDPFLGGGTTIAVADRLKRQWIGIDQSVAAVKVSELRLNKQRDLFSAPFTVQLHKYDYDTLRNNNAFEFETWIIQQYGGVANTKQRSDLGIDGRDKTGIPIQVKRSDNIGRNVVDNFASACRRYDKNLFDNNIQANISVGIIIAFSFGKGAIQEVARLKNEENIIIQLITVNDIIPIATKPSLSVTFTALGVNDKQLHIIEFIAIGVSASGIEFYAWDFNYNANEGFKPAIVRDKNGKQTQNFKTGKHCIAVKVIDNDGLENTVILHLTLNNEVRIDD